jgi:hypothetical protein
MIHPAYVHYASVSDRFVKDDAPFLPVGQMYAGELIECQTGADLEYFDCQLDDLATADGLSNYDCFGISVMGAQDIAPSEAVYRQLLQRGVRPEQIYLGGQGVEALTREEYQAVFGSSHQVSRRTLSTLPGYMDVVIARQVEKLSARALRTYLTHELTLLLSQGCMYGCSFCGAQTRRREEFYDTHGHLEYLAAKARSYGITRLQLYCTSLDFFQQALPNQDIGLLIRKLEEIIEIKDRFGLTLELRALTRAGSYNAAMASAEVLSLVKAAGFRKFGFGADGAASLEILKAMRRGTATLKSDLLSAFDHAENHGLVPEMLYVFGIPEDTEETLAATRDFLIGLLDAFPTSQYRGFPAKNEIPGNQNWGGSVWRNSSGYRSLFAEPQLFLNLGFETLANVISHQDPVKRRLVNRFAVEMSLIAHRYGRVQSFLTVPVIREDGSELMDEQTCEWFREIIRQYVGSACDTLSLASLAESRVEVNRHIPKDR